MFLLTENYLYCLVEPPVISDQSLNFKVKAKIHLKWVLCDFIIKEYSKVNKYYIEFIRNDKKIICDAVDQLNFEKWRNALRSHVIQLNINKRYCIKDVVSKQQYSKIYRAEQVSTDNLYFVEKVRKGKLLDNKVFESIKNQIKILKALYGYPGVQQLFEIYESLNTVYLIYQPYTGVHVFNNAIKYDSQIFVKVLKNILSIIKLLESKNIIHGHLRPENIFFKESNINHESMEIILTDFSYCRNLKSYANSKASSIGLYSKTIGLTNNQQVNVDIIDLGRIATNYPYFVQFNRIIK